VTTLAVVLVGFWCCVGEVVVIGDDEGFCCGEVFGFGVYGVRFMPCGIGFFRVSWFPNLLRFAGLCIWLTSTALVLTVWSILQAEI
jgi:hypothetical protein